MKYVQDKDQFYVRFQGNPEPSADAGGRTTDLRLAA